MANLFKKGWPYMLAVLIFIVLTVTYFNPVLSGKKLAQMDDIHARGMAKELVDHQAATGEKAARLLDRLLREKRKLYKA